MNLPRPQKALATGRLSKTPFPHLLLYLYEHRYTGTLTVQGVEQREPARVRFDHGFATGIVAPMQSETLAMTMMPLCGLADGDYAFYEGQDMVGASSGALVGSVDPYPFLARALRVHACDDAVDGLLARYESAPLGLGVGLDLPRFSLRDDERAVTDLLEGEALTIEDLTRAAPLRPQRLRRLLYLLIITKAVAPQRASMHPGVAGFSNFPPPHAPPRGSVVPPAAHGGTGPGSSGQGKPAAAVPDWQKLVRSTRPPPADLQALAAVESPPIPPQAAVPGVVMPSAAPPHVPTPPPPPQPVAVPPPQPVAVPPPPHAVAAPPHAVAAPPPPQLVPDPPPPGVVPESSPPRAIDTPPPPQFIPTPSPPRADPSPGVVPTSSPPQAIHTPPPPQFIPTPAPPPSVVPPPPPPPPRAVISTPPPPPSPGSRSASPLAEGPPSAPPPQPEQVDTGQARRLSQPAPSHGSVLPPEGTEAVLRRVELLCERERHYDALQALEPLLLEHVGDARIHAMYAWVLFHRAAGEAIAPDALSQALSQALRLDPNQPRALYVAGLQRKREGRMVEAQRYFTRACGVDMDALGADDSLRLAAERELRLLDMRRRGR